MWNLKCSHQEVGCSLYALTLIEYVAFENAVIHIFVTGNEDCGELLGSNFSLNTIIEAKQEILKLMIFGVLVMCCISLYIFAALKYVIQFNNFSCTDYVFV